MITHAWRVDVLVRDHRLLAKMMDHHDLSVRQLADRVRYNRSSIGHLRSGKRTTCPDDLAKRIAKALDCPTDLLFETRTSIVSREVSRAA